MATIKITVDGIKPLLTHNPLGMFDVKGGKGNQIPSAEEEAERGTYRLADGSCAIPGVAFRGAILGAAGAWKGNRARSTMKSALAHIEIIEELVPLLHRDGKPIKDYAIDRRRAKIQKSGIIRSRPRFDEWSATFTVSFDELLVPKPNVLIEIANDAGQRIGVGDFRPQTNGWFGRFVVRQ